MSLPISTVIKQLEDPVSIIPILKSLHSNIKTLTSSKAEANHLSARTLALLSSHPPQKKWYGVLVASILIKNYEILSSSGLKFMNLLLKILETTNLTTNPKLFRDTVICLDNLCDEIRGKPTLTREMLTPKLPVIIQTYLNNIDMNPQLVIHTLSKLMWNHPTTFRPFGNKLNARIVEYLLLDFNNFPTSLKSELSQSYALLPIIEKNEPETFWLEKFNKVINETVDILSVFKDLIDFSQDPQLTSLINDQNFKIDDSSRIFPFLQIDISKPETLLQLCSRIEILIELLVGFVSTSIKMCVKFPVGKLVTLIEIVFGINTRFLPVRRDIRDEKVRSLIVSIITSIQNYSLKLVNQSIETFNSPMMMYLNNIILALEAAIPINKKSLDTEVVFANESFLVNVLKTASNVLGLVELFLDPQQLVRFVDTALALVEPRVNDTTDNKAKDTVNNNSKKNKKKNQAIPMADLLSHGHLFNSEVPESTISVVREFIGTVISRVELPSNQYYKIMRYLVIEAIRCCHFNYNRVVPEDLKQLLLKSVIYPGFEKVSILPIVSSIMGNDPLISVFNNPRFPPIPQLITKSVEQEDEDYEDESEQETKQVFAEEPNSLSEIVSKRSADDEVVSVKRVKIEVQTDEPQEEKVEHIDASEVLQFKEEPKEESKPLPTPTPVGHKEITETVQTTEPLGLKKIDPTPVVSTNADSDSEFEMPEIDIDDSGDEE